MTRKIKNKRLVVLLSALFFSCFSFAQTDVLHKDEFLSIVRAYHPVVKQANLRVGRANAETQGARGGFDPLLAAGARQKTLDGKEYYTYFNPELVVPTWYGVEVKAGVESASGYRLNPETTDGNLGYLGVKVPLNALVYDKRRAALQQAKAMAVASEYDMQVAVNNVSYEALSAYWNWVRDYELYRNVSSLLKINTDRQRFVKIEVEQGNKAAIDTTEAFGQYQAIYQQQGAALLAWRNSGVELSAYLWQENGNPAQLPGTVIPDSAELNNIAQKLPELDSLLNVAVKHPKLRSMDAKMDVLELEQKLKRQSIAPKVSVNAGLLSKKYPYGTINQAYMEQNNKIGFDFSMPLFLREARAGVKVAGFKIQEMSLEISQAEMQILNKVRIAFAEVASLMNQVNDYQKAYAAYVVLYNGEYQRFNIGESSLFLLNSRETKMLEASQKLIELKAKYQKASAALLASIAAWG